MAEHTPYQKKLIKRYYDNQDLILRQRLSELVGNLYLAEGKKRDRLWDSAAQAMEKLGIVKSRVEHLLAKRDPVLLAELVKEIEARPTQKEKGKKRG